MPVYPYRREVWWHLCIMLEPAKVLLERWNEYPLEPRDGQGEADRLRNCDRTVWSLLRGHRALVEVEGALCATELTRGLQPLQQDVVPGSQDVWKLFARYYRLGDDAAQSRAPGLDCLTAISPPVLCRASMSGPPRLFRRAVVDILGDGTVTSQDSSILIEW